MKNPCEFTFETDDPNISYSICWSVEMPCSTVELDQAAAQIVAASVGWGLGPLRKLKRVLRCFPVYDNVKVHSLCNHTM